MQTCVTGISLDCSLIRLQKISADNIAPVNCFSFQGIYQAGSSESFWECSLFQLLIFKSSKCCKSTASIKIDSLCNLPHATGRQEEGFYIYYSPSQFSKASTECKHIYIFLRKIVQPKQNPFCIGFAPMWMRNIQPLAGTAEFNIKENGEQKQLHRESHRSAI